MRFRLAVLLAVLTAVAVPATASASEIIDRNASDVSLKVAQNGQALVSFNARGKRWNVLAWGAINALQPTTARKQVEFKLDYSGGYGTYKRDVWKTFKNACRAYDGPELQWFVAGCKAADGSYWALQSWQRALPNYGLKATPKQSRLGASAVALARRAAGADGQPELGLPQVPPHLRLVHVPRQAGPRLQVDLGRRPARHVRPQPLPRHLQLGLRPGLEAREQLPDAQGHRQVLLRLLQPRQPARGSRRRSYRATIIGPGVLPDIYWEADALGAYDKDFDLQMHAAQKEFLAGDPLCKAVSGLAP